MKKSYTFKIGGQAGFGILTTGLIFSKTAVRSGYHVFDYFEYPSLIRGGHNVTETHFSPDPVYSQEEKIDVLVCLNRETYDLHIHEIKEGGVVIYDPSQFVPNQTANRVCVSLLAVPFADLLSKIGASKLMENNVAIGASCALFGFDLNILNNVIAATFAGKGEKIILANQQSAKEGYNFVANQFVKLGTLNPAIQAKKTSSKSGVITGNEAVGLGAIAGNCKFYAAYPMTPSSGILHMLASYATKTGMVVRHAEDEIGVINEAIGASFAGARSMVATSGGGFALMVEAISLAGICERGIVIVLGQRPGPATGMPTWTEQGELLFAIHAGHGEFPKIVLAPGDVAEAMTLTAKAHNLADIYQTPVIILTDKYIAESHQDIEIDSIISNIPSVDRGKWANPSPDAGGKIAPFPRYQLTNDGISPRLRPGTKGFYYQENSYEHIEDGHTTELSLPRIDQVNKRNRKALTYLKNHFSPPTLYGTPDADITLVGWGSVKCPILEVLMNRQDELSGKSVNFLHFTHLWPLDKEKISQELKKFKRLVLVENNSTAQFGQLLCQATGIEIDKKFLKYDGRPIYPADVINFICKL